MHMLVNGVAKTANTCRVAQCFNPLIMFLLKMYWIGLLLWLYDLTYKAP